eukprot:scaffold157252_cov45-Prasinocladus_malaysianus.AAC.1
MRYIIAPIEWVVASRYEYLLASSTLPVLGPAGPIDVARATAQAAGDRQRRLDHTKLPSHLCIMDSNTYESVQNYYGKVLGSTKDLKTSACTAAGRPHPELLRLIRQQLPPSYADRQSLTPTILYEYNLDPKQVPAEINDRFYGCGAPIPLGITGRRVLDLGSGTGRDCYVAASLVGEEGFVTGIDMTEEQLEISNKYVKEFCDKQGFSKPNMKFVKASDSCGHLFEGQRFLGFIEYLDQAGIEDESQDLVISNCVVNLSPDKPRVISEAYRVLAPGGEFFFSDVYCDRRLPKEVQQHEV